MQKTDKNVSDIWQFYCASWMRITANRWSDSQQSRVRARTLPVDENGYRVDNNVLIGYLAERTWMKAWQFTTAVFTENFGQKRQLLTHFSTSKFKWPMNWCLVFCCRIHIKLWYFQSALEGMKMNKIMIRHRKYACCSVSLRSAHAHRKWKLIPIRRFL